MYDPVRHVGPAVAGLSSRPRRSSGAGPLVLVLLAALLTGVLIGTPLAVLILASD